MRGVFCMNYTLLFVCMCVFMPLSFVMCVCVYGVPCCARHRKKKKNEPVVRGFDVVFGNELTASKLASFPHPLYHL
jgi:hypothetical protein